MLKKNKIVLLLLVLGTTLFAKKEKLDISLQLQPLYTVSEEGDFSDSGYNKLSIHRAKLGVAFNKKTKHIDLSSKVSLDFAEKKYDNMLKNAWGSLKFNKIFGIKAGQFKTEFGLESSKSSQTLSLINRGAITDYLRSSIAIAGYNQGVQFYGTIIKNLTYRFSVYNYEGISTKSGNFSSYLNRLFALPMVSLEYDLIPNLKVSYILALPYVGTTLEDGSVVGDRYTFNNIGVELTFNRSETLFDLFIGSDTSSFRQFRYYLDGFNEGVTNGLGITETVNFPLNKKIRLDISGRFEYLNGYYYDGLDYLDRSFYSTLTAGTKLHYKEWVSVEGQIDNEFSRNFSSTHNLQIVLQATILFNPSIALK